MRESLSKLAAGIGRRMRRSGSPFVSVVIPTYNCAAFITRAIDSVLTQEPVPLEVIVVDDASTDETPKLLRSRYRKTPNVRVLRHARNRDLGAARNTGLEIARGKYVFFLDSDDWIEPGALHHLTSLAERTDIEIFACGVQLAYPDGRLAPYHAHAFTCDGGRAALRELIRYRIGSICWNKLYRRDFIERHRLRFVEAGKEDVVFSTEAVYACRKYVSIDNIYYNYFQRQGSIIRTVPTTYHLDSYIRLYLDIVRFVARHRLDADPEGAEISRGLFWAHCSGDLFPKLLHYIRTRPQEQWEEECWSTCHELLGTAGLAVADALVRALRDSASAQSQRAAPPAVEAP